MRGPLSKFFVTTTAWVTLAFQPVWANPLGGRVVGGSASIQGQGTSQVTVTQSTNRAIINWNTFNIGAGEQTRFVQPNASSITLNRVTGGLGPSQLYGTLTANGRVFLVNPDGILVGPGAVIDTAGFLATSSDIKNRDFMRGRYNFSIPGNPNASIVNLGSITATGQGFAALVAPGVRNSGTITATLGKVSLASGNVFALDFYGDSLIKLAVTDSIAAQVKDAATGQPLKSLVSNDGKLSANGGQVQLSAVTARQIVDAVINNKGVIEANSIGTQNGQIVLMTNTATSKVAGAPTQMLLVSGTLSAAGQNSGETGGTIQVTGENIILANARLNASGDAGGGKVLIGGDWGGGHPTMTIANASAKLEPNLIPTATNVSIDARTTIDASAVQTGNGGKVIVWSEGSTNVAGTIFARGGLLTGNGGFVETSGHSLNINGSRVDTSAQSGRTGSWLLDPDDYVIGSAEAATIAANLALTQQTIQTTAGGTGGFGDITVSADITWGSSNSLTLSAFRNIAINASITNSGGAAVTIRVDNTGTGTGTLGFGAAGMISTSGLVSLFYNSTSNPPGSTVNSTSYVNPTENFASWVTGGATVASYMLVNTINDLQNIQNNLAGSYALGRNIDAGTTANWNNGAGFVPIGQNYNPFSGKLDGQNFAISNLWISRSALDNSGDNTGLIGANAGVLQNLSLSGGSISGRNSVGALVGTNTGSIQFAYASSSVAGVFYVGGLVGENSGNIASSNAAGAVTGAVPSFGLSLGGLVGFNRIPGSIVKSYATGAITATSNDDHAIVGGLVSLSYGVIDQSFSTGSVTNSSDSGTSGGLVGINQGSITRSYSTSAVTNTNTNGIAGGLVGTNATVYGPGLISQTYAAGTMSSSSPAGGLVGINGFASISASYWDVQATGQASGFASNVGVFNAVGLTSTQARLQSAYVGWDFNNTWFMIDGQTRPFLRSEWSTTITNAHQLQLMAVNLSANYTVANNINLGPALAPDSNGNYPGMWGSAGFVPIGSDASPFIGILNGQGYSIYGLSITRPTSDQVGLIGTLGNGSLDPAVTSVNLANATIVGRNNTGALVGTNFFGAITQSSASGTVTGLGRVGGLVGWNRSGTISQSTAAVAVTVGDGTPSSVSQNGHGYNLAGGLVGQNSGTITFSGASGALISNAYAWAGGLVGFNSGPIVSSYATGSLQGVSASDLPSAVGGLVGTNNGSIASSYASVAITFIHNSTVGNRGQVGGLVGTNIGTIATISDSYAIASIFVNSQNATVGPNVGGLVGINGGSGSNSNGSISNSYALIESVSGIGPAVAYVQLTPTSANGIAVGGLVGYNNFNGQITGSYAIPSPTASNPILTVSNLAFIGGLAGTTDGTISNSYAKINVSGTNAVADGVINAGGFTGSNRGSISNSYSTGNVTVSSGPLFAGTLAGTGGGGFTGGNGGGLINNSYSTGDVLLIGTTANSNLRGGGFVGFNSAIINASYALGSVRVDNISSYTIAGGFTGTNSGGPISQSYATGTVTVNGAQTQFAGGFLGINFSAGLISNSYTMSSVTNSTSNNAIESFIGGFAGLNIGSLDRTYATGPVAQAPSSIVGGFAGSNTMSALTYGNLPTRLQALVSFQNGVVTNSYWDKEQTNQPLSAGGTGLLTAQATQKSSYVNFDFVGMWTINAAYNNGYPYLLTVPVQPSTSLPTSAPVVPPVAPPTAQISYQQGTGLITTIDQNPLLIPPLAGRTFTPVALDPSGSGALTEQSRAAVDAMLTQGGGSATVAVSAVPAQPFSFSRVAGPLSSGEPVILQGTVDRPGGPVNFYMLAVGLTSDRNIIANDPLTGHQVIIDRNSGKVIVPQDYPMPSFQVTGTVAVAIR